MQTRMRAVALLAVLGLTLEAPRCGEPVGQQPNVSPAPVTKPTKRAPDQNDPRALPQPSAAPSNVEKTRDDRKHRVEFRVAWHPQNAEMSIRWQVDNKAESVIWGGGLWNKWTVSGTSGTLATLEVEFTEKWPRMEAWISCTIKVDGEFIRPNSDQEFTPYAHVLDGEDCYASVVVP